MSEAMIALMFTGGWLFFICMIIWILLRSQKQLADQTKLLLDLKGKEIEKKVDNLSLEQCVKLNNEDRKGG